MYPGTGQQVVGLHLGIVGDAHCGLHAGMVPRGMGQTLRRRLVREWEQRLSANVSAGCHRDSTFRCRLVVRGIREQQLVRHGHSDPSGQWRICNQCGGSQ